MTTVDEHLTKFHEDIQEKVTDIIMKVIEDYDRDGTPVASPHVMAKEITKYIFKELL